MSKSKLIDFIDAVIAGNEEAETLAFAEYTESKSKELLCPAAVAPEVVVPEATVNEADLGDGIRLEGNTVYVDGKKVGVIKYFGDDETDMKYTTVDGRTMNVKNNDIEDLVRIITHLNKEL